MDEKPVVSLGTWVAERKAIHIMGAVARALRLAAQSGKIKTYLTEASAGGFDNVLAVSQKYVQIQQD